MVNVIGLGYVGLPTALMLAAHGVPVVGTDRDPRVIEGLTRGQMTFREPGLDAVYHAAAARGIRFSMTCERADTYIIAVPTPLTEDGARMDAGCLLSAVEQALAVCPEGAALVIESTVAPGTMDRLLRPLIGQRHVHLVHAPERVIPGNTVEEMRRNSRVIGADDRAVGERIAGLYASFCQGRIEITDLKTAEMTKVAENTFRAVNIAFANELAKICRREQVDVYEVIRLCNAHPRVDILQPGPGVGGHCVPVDPYFLTEAHPNLAEVTAAALRVNGGMPDHVLGRIGEIMAEKGIADYSRVGLYGLTYKENVDDTRNAPALQLLSRQRGRPAAAMKTYDPYVFADLTPHQYHDLDAFLRDVDLAVILIPHEQILRQAQKLRGKTVLDCRRCLPLPGAYTL